MKMCLLVRTVFVSDCVYFPGSKFMSYREVEHGHYRGHGLHAAAHVREAGSVSESINRGLRITGIPAVLWFQCSGVLLVYLVRIHRIQPANCRRLNNVWYHLPFRRRPLSRREGRKTTHPSLHPFSYDL